MGRQGKLILGIETAGKVAGAALLRDGAVIGSRSSTGPHSALLLPMIAELLGSHDLCPSDLTAIAAARGPGSYTGLRVGVVTAKALGRATSAVVIGVPTLDAMASHAPAEADRVWVLLEAYKRKVLTATFVRDDDSQLVLVGEPDLLAASSLPPDTDAAVVVTDAPELLREQLRGRSVVAVPGPGAEAVAAIAAERLAAGAADESYSLSPVYLRPPPVTLSKRARR